MNGPELIRAVQEAPAVHALLISTRDRKDLSSRECGLALAAILMTLVATRGGQPSGLSQAGNAAVLALNPGGELHSLAPAPGGSVTLYAAEQAWSDRNAWGFVTVSGQGTHSRSGTLGTLDLNLLALSAILEGLMSIPHGSTVQVYSRNMNADGYLSGKYRAKTAELQALIDDVKTVVLQGGLTVHYDFMTDRARRTHAGMQGAEDLTLSTVRSSA